MTEDALQVHLVQGLIQWHDPDRNLASFDTLVSGLQTPGLVVLPEMWNTGFTMKAHLFDGHTSAALDSMKNWSRSLGCAVTGSVITREKDRYYNRLYFVDQGEVMAWYDKKHLFSFSGEERSFHPGKEKVVVEYRGWKICLNICYDLRFPVWSRNFEDFDVLLYAANWPDKRILAWHTLLRARAIENQCYCLGVNCVGEDAWKNRYSGHTAAFAYDGSALMDGAPEERVFSIHLGREELREFRKKFPFLRDRDTVRADWETRYFRDSK